MRALHYTGIVPLFVGLFMLLLLLLISYLYQLLLYNVIMIVILILLFSTSGGGDPILSTFISVSCHPEVIFQFYWFWYYKSYYQFLVGDLFLFNGNGLCNHQYWYFGLLFGSSYVYGRDGWIQELILLLLQCIIAIPTGIKVFSLVSYSLVVILISVTALFFRFYNLIYSQAVSGIILANGY